MKILQSYFLLILICLSNTIFAQNITLSSGQITIPTLKQINQDWSFYRQNNAPNKFYFKVLAINQTPSMTYYKKMIVLIRNNYSYNIKKHFKAQPLLLNLAEYFSWYQLYMLSHNQVSKNLILKELQAIEQKLKKPKAILEIQKYVVVDYLNYRLPSSFKSLSKCEKEIVINLLFKQALRVQKRDDEREAFKAVASNYQENKEKTLLRNRHFRNVLALMNNQNFQSELSNIQYFYEQNRFDKKVQTP